MEPSADNEQIAISKTPKARRLRMKISSKGIVEITAPMHVKDTLIQSFINDNAEWIARQRSKLSLMKPTQDDEALLFGKTYAIIIDSDDNVRVGVRLVGNTLLIKPVNLTATVTDESVQNQLRRFYRTAATHYIHSRLPEIAEAMNTSHGKIVLREQSSRWGSCSSSGTLSFNWRLAHAPAAVIDYVIIHELAHRTHMNHSPQFWHLVAQFDPAFRTHKGWLKRHGQWII